MKLQTHEIDAMRHADWMKSVAEKNMLAARIAGWGHEIEQLIGAGLRIFGEPLRIFPKPQKDDYIAPQRFVMDIINNERGISIAGTSKTPKDLLNEGKLTLMRSDIKRGPRKNEEVER